MIVSVTHYSLQDRLSQHVILIIQKSQWTKMTMITRKIMQLMNGRGWYKRSFLLPLDMSGCCVLGNWWCGLLLHINLVDIPSHTLLIPVDGRTRGTTVYRVIYTRIDAYKYSFFPRTILTWSHIPQELRLVPTIDQFRAGIGSVTLKTLFSIWMI
jgi:hypothetical protein